MKTANPPLHGPGPWYAAGAALLFASAGIASRFAPAGVPAAMLGVVRLLVGGVALATFMGPRALAAALLSLPYMSLAAAALAMALFQWSFFAAIDRAGVGVVSLICVAAGPVFADLLDTARARRPASLAAGAGLTALGIACLALGGNASGAGIGLALVAGAAYAAYAAAAARLEGARPGAGLTSTTLALLLAGLALLPAAGRSYAPMLSASGLLLTAYLGLAATALAYVLFVSALRRISAASALAILLVQPVAAVLAGVALFDEPVNAMVVVGIVFIAAAVGTRRFVP